MCNCSIYWKSAGFTLFSFLTLFSCPPLIIQMKSVCPSSCCLLSFSDTCCFTSYLVSVSGWDLPKYKFIFCLRCRPLMPSVSLPAWEFRYSSLCWIGLPSVCAWWWGPRFSPYSRCIGYGYFNFKYFCAYGLHAPNIVTFPGSPLFRFAFWQVVYHYATTSPISFFNFLYHSGHVKFSGHIGGRVSWSSNIFCLMLFISFVKESSFCFSFFSWVRIDVTLLSRTVCFLFSWVIMAIMFFAPLLQYLQYQLMLSFSLPVSMAYRASVMFWHDLWNQVLHTSHVQYCFVVILHHYLTVWAHFCSVVHLGCGLPCPSICYPFWLSILVIHFGVCCFQWVDDFEIYDSSRSGANTK